MMELIKNDKLFDLKIIISDQCNNPVNLTDATILFKMKNVKSSNIIINGACTIINASAGICSYYVLDGDLSTAGIYYAEAQITFSDGKVQTAKLDNIKILEDI